MMVETSPMLLNVRDLKVQFKVRPGNTWPWTPQRTLTAVNGVSFHIAQGETLGIVGESGCGKSTLARGVLNLIPSSSGSIQWMGQELVGASPTVWHSVRRDIQMIFQDPLASLNPRMTVAQIIAEPLRTHHPALSQVAIMVQVVDMMERVGLAQQHINRYPHEFSGGQCQRIGMARALILRPKLVICDEPVSSLDVSIQAQIINLLKELQQSMGLSLVFIAHDLAAVKHISDRIMVMYLGQAVEKASKHNLYSQPQHPYTRALLSAIPVPDPRLERAKTVNILSSDLPSPLDPPSGCAFRTRCPQAMARCAQESPSLREVTAHSEVSCWLS
jgi:oligopeptide transport system ATP-binding protein